MLVIKPAQLVDNSESPTEFLNVHTQDTSAIPHHDTGKSWTPVLRQKYLRPTGGCRKSSNHSPFPIVGGFQLAALTQNLSLSYKD